MKENQSIVKFKSKLDKLYEDLYDKTPLDERETEMFFDESAMRQVFERTVHEKYSDQVLHPSMNGGF